MYAFFVVFPQPVPTTGCHDSVACYTVMITSFLVGVVVGAAAVGLIWYQQTQSGKKE